MITGKNYVGNDLQTNGTVTFTTFSPKLNLPNSELHFEASDSEINSAVELAHTAFQTYRGFSGKRKAEFLNAIADEILDLGDELVEVYMKESGLPEGRAKGERGRTIGQLRTFAELVAEGSWVDARIDTAIPDRAPIPKTDLRKMNSALGPIVVFGASNFPLAYSTAGGDTASALAAGCPVIVKAHPMHAGTSELVASAIIKAALKTKMPNGIFSNLNSKGIEVGVKLVEHPKVKGVGFTGSIRGGRALYDLAAKRAEPIPVFAEMGSINPVVIMPEYLNENNEQVAKTYAGSITLGTGQFCTNPGLILGIKGTDLDQFIQTLGEQIQTIDPMCMLHPAISENFANSKERMLAQDGLKVVSSYSNQVEPNYAGQMIARVDGATFKANKNMHQEVFGPYSMVVECENSDELTAVIDNLEGQLTGTIMATAAELGDHPELTNSLSNRVGRIIHNGVPTGVEVCPSMLHGGPYPASTDSRFTAVGTDSIKRWVRPISYQSWPNELLPKELQNHNPLKISRKLNNVDSRDAIVE
ncbi:MAG: alpha-ketoglutaric semialdehyde dehydrogenase [Crocinitomicaceae bacterium]|jgi:alpha-ketoglutaric semialdehyde dehydrogenase